MAKDQPIEGEIVKNEIAVLLDEQGVTENNIRSEIVEAFGGPFTAAGEILANFSKDEEGNLVPGKNAIVVSAVDQVDAMKEARAQRLALREARITIENNRKSLKDESLKRGQAIDTTARALKQFIEPVEKYLETQEKFAELKAAEEKAQRFAARTSAIAKFTDPGLYNLNDMEEPAFQELLIKLEKEEADRVAAERAEIERKAAEEKAERERQAEIARENERLQREAREREIADQRKMDRVNQVTSLGMRWNHESQAYEGLDQVVTALEILELNDVKWKIVLDKVAKVFADHRDAEERKRQEEQAAAEEQARKDREAAEAERKKREELEQAEAERKAAEEKAAADRAAAEHAALLAPDKEKIKSILPRLENLKLDLPATKDQKAQEIVNNTYDMLEKIAAYINDNVEKL